MESFRERSAAAPREGSDSRHQLPERKWLGEIVVGAHFQPRDTIVDGIASGQHEDRRSDLAGTQLAAEIESASTRQHHVENDDIKSAEHGLHLSVSIVGDGYNLDSVLGEAGLDDRGQPGVVFD